MTRQEMIKEIGAKAGRTQKEVAEVMDTFQDVVIEAMKQEQEVKIMSGVTLAGVHKDAREARNPATGETVSVVAKTAPKAKFGVGLKKAINE